MWKEISFAEYSEAYHAGLRCVASGLTLKGSDFWEYECKDGFDYRTETLRGESKHFRYIPSDYDINCGYPPVTNRNVEVEETEVDFEREYASARDELVEVVGKLQKSLGSLPETGKSAVDEHDVDSVQGVLDDATTALAHIGEYIQEKNQPSAYSKAQRLLGNIVDNVLGNNC